MCYLCLAGRETLEPTIPFEDFSETAAWKSTYLTELPYDTVPSMMKGLPWGPDHEGATFFKHDLWHHWHAGLAKQFVASACVEINLANLLPGNSIDAGFEALSNLYKEFCRSSNMSPYLKALNRDTFGMESSKVFPSGSWNKASVSTELMMFLGHVCSHYIEGQTTDALLLAIISWLA